MADRSEENTGMLARVMSVLRCFTDDHPELPATRIAELTGLAPSTLHRLLARLTDEGMLARTPAHTYTIGGRLWELGELSPLALRLRETALPHLTRLYESTGENVQLAVLDGPSPERSTALSVARITGHASIRIVGRIGGRHPLHTTGVGKALLATRDEQWLARYFAAPLERETVHSITDETELRADIARSRARGFAVTHEEMTLGNVSVATALPPIDGLPPIALGLVVHLARADERQLAPITIQAARDLARALQKS